MQRIEGEPIMNDDGGTTATVLADRTLLCPKCGRRVDSLRCGHCGSQLPPWQADLYGAVAKQIARTGGDRADAGHQGGGPTSTPLTSDDGDPTKDNGTAKDDLDDGEGSLEAHGGITAYALAGGGNHRRENDAYYSPQWAIDALLAVENFEGLTWEPAEGDGRIVAALQEAGCEVFGTDVTTGIDFLATTREVANIVTNPPWGLRNEFIRHAKECASHKVALLLPLSSLSGVARRPLFEDATFPLRALYVFVRRLNFDPNAQGSTTLTTGWFVWERGYSGEPVLRWISES